MHLHRIASAGQLAHLGSLNLKIPSPPNPPSPFPQYPGLRQIPDLNLQASLHQSLNPPKRGSLAGRNKPPSGSSI